MSALRPLPLGLSLKRNLVDRLRSKGEVLRFGEDPLTATLCTCVGLLFEVGNPEWDRLSPFFGCEPNENWEKDLVEKDGEIGIRLRRQNGQPLWPRHPDLRLVLDSSSLDSDGVMRQAVIFPRRVQQAFSRLGFELVIVRDWILSSALCLEGAPVTYLRANEWEIRTRIADTQAPMLVRAELAFFGTHDIVDHLFGADKSGFSQLAPLHQRAARVLPRSKGGGFRESRPHLLLSYLVGILLDDLAQPRWYGSLRHARAAERCLDALETFPIRPGSLIPLESFHTLVAQVRDPQATLEAVSDGLGVFLDDIARPLSLSVPFQICS